VTTRKTSTPGQTTPSLPPAAPGPRGVRLRSSENVRAELARTYRAFTAGRIDASAARTRGFLLQTLAGVIRDEKLGEIEEQLEQLRREGVLK
jgi:hypothetical protein